ncbi:PREDICTED: cytochrome P450 76A2-like [Ipomoea nil]|uniref:cytochrome P450 76A2-like n=1 Tax=Ipomoea nil TaxID=35883 RepID=UPI000900CF76|nr:PREDICTED: cytochrome P450 76A2-like [Ipomoea nil]
MGSLLLFIFLLLPPLMIFVFFPRKSKSYKLPPGPRGLPVLGNMLDLGPELHKTMEGLKQEYGPVVWLRIGTLNTVVIQTVVAATELFKNHDVSFADRKIRDVNWAYNYADASLALAPYGAFWRVLRRICSAEMFTGRKMNDTAAIRRKSVDDMLMWIEKEAIAAGRGGVEVARFAFLASFNMLGNIVMSRDLADPDAEITSEFFNAMTRIMEWSGRPNISDIFPCLRLLDLQGLRRKMARDLRITMGIASSFLKERMKEGADDTENLKDFLSVLLEFKGKGKDEPEKLSEHEILVLIVEMFLAGTETTSSTVEWAMTELLKNPEAMEKVRAEISKVVGSEKKLEENDIDNLPYLQAVVKETFRLHPPLPFLIPRKAVEDTKFMGYDVPKDTQVLVNVWAMGRDPECWEDPLTFKPERFLGSNIDVKGQHFELIPFGAGRRICVGLPLGHRMTHLVLGSLLHQFEWAVERCVDPKTMDMRDRVGITLRKLQPLKAI